MTASLQQEYIIRIKMRTDAAARHGITHHQIVQPRMRDKIESLQQCFAARQVMIQFLHQ
ncbi:hypothetical protein GALL_511410 [mine drainage metagenome]|uniref:Uncharacterized protein n=1 Tax=mine drainage metagenome TaxID=410659 RepID=A0A1J5P949_9ZZZZ